MRRVKLGALAFVVAAFSLLGYAASPANAGAVPIRGGAVPVVYVQDITWGFSDVPEGTGPTQPANMREVKEKKPSGGVSTQWSYCPGATIWPGALNLYDRQGYCGTLWYRVAQEQHAGVCYSLFGSNANNQASALQNSWVNGISVFDHSDCNQSGTPGAAGYYAGGTSTPNLCATPALCERISSYMWD